ncbi:hypothetical protein MLD52_00835 [Puniceicoccaceae bacterium K14]|nr:hypothetical protein [Puniceicoccaceae bacterium K14]
MKKFPSVFIPHYFQIIRASALTIFLSFPSLFVNGSQPIPLTISPDIRHQTIEGFGASDAWNVNFVGKHWSHEEKSKMAERLFSKELDSTGSPKGIGLSIWRFNIGAGSAAQGDSSQIKNHTRRTEGFLNADGSYDWSKQNGQQWFFKRARDYGVESLIAFSNSPPISMTRNGIAHGYGGYISNLNKKDYPLFASFLCDVVSHFANEGICFDKISPINEPQYEWKTTKQEGSPWTNEEIFKVVRALNKELIERNLDTKILFPEAADWRNLYKTKGQDTHSHQLRAFFDPSSETYLGNIERVGKRFAVHSYWTNQSEKSIVESRSQSLALAQKLGVQLHQTEYSLIALDRIEHNKPSNGWEVAQFIAKIIHYDLTHANVASWSFWTSMAYENNNLNRYILLRLLPEKDKALASGGTHQATKSLFSLGNYSRFIRPGYQRIEATHPPVYNEQNETVLLVSAFISPDKSEMICVLSNLSKSPIEVSLPILKENSSTKRKTYLTDSEFNLSLRNSLLIQNTITLPPQSIVTIVEASKL